MSPADALRAHLALQPTHRLALALDFSSWREAAPLATTLAPHLGFLKVGLELFLREGPAVVRQVSALRPVFLDLKLHDIPETVERAAASLIDSGARLLTLHAACGGAALERVARLTASTPLTPVAVTVLTSLSAEDLARQGLGSPADHALRLASMAWDSGIRAFVTSPHEVTSLRRRFPEALLITPGVRTTAGGDDQQRTSGPREAIAAGSDLLVVGRPLRDAADPLAAARAFADAVAEGLAGGAS